MRAARGRRTREQGASATDIGARSGASLGGCYSTWSSDPSDPSDISGVSGLSGRAPQPADPAAAGRTRGRRRVAGVAGAIAGCAALVVALSSFGVADSGPRARPVATVTATDEALAARADVTYIAECDPDSRVRRPTEVILTCGDGTEMLEELKWQGWGEERATAQGVFVSSDCNPTCAQGKPLRFEAKVVADQLVQGEAAATYRRLTVDVAAGSGNEQQEVYHLPGIDPGQEHGGQDDADLPGATSGSPSPAATSAAR